MKKVILVAVAVLGILALFAVGASATDGELVANGDFEFPEVTAAAKWDIWPSGTSGLGWTVEWLGTTTSYGGYPRPSTANLELHEGVLGPSNTGDQLAELDTDWNGPVAAGPNGEPASVKIYQDLATCPGETYVLTYAWSPRPNHSDNKIDVYWDAGKIATHSGSGASSTNWTVETHPSLTASSDSTRLEFWEVGQYDDSLGMFLDSVSVTGPTHPCLLIEKTLVSGDDPIGIYLPGPTQYVFKIAYEGPAAKVIDTVPAEFECVVQPVPTNGTATCSKTGGLKSANRIVWDVPAGSNTLTVTIQTVLSPGKGHKATVYKPTSCGPLPLNDGAIAYEVDELWNLVLVEVVDPDTLEVTLEPVVIVGPSNSLVVEAVEGAKPCEEG